MRGCDIFYVRKMFARTAGKVGVLLVCLSLFSTCGELDTLFPSNGSYQVRTMVNGSSLEDCSIVRSDDKIRPYFAVSVVNDPDLIGLLVYLQDSQGKIVGERVQYILEQYAQEAPQATETEIEENEEEVKQEETEDPASEEAEVVDEEENEADQIDEIDETSEENDWMAWELPEYGAAREKWSFTDTKPVVQTADIEIAVKSFADYLPYFPLPKNLEIGSYTLVFEALGKGEILSRTETYILYLGDAEFNLKDVSMYLPGLSGSQLVSPGTTVMLEAGLDFDSRLDPYVIWYNGKNIISQGTISEGAGKILWKAPEQVGFYSLRLEAFPFYLKRNNFTGVSREVALPVSPKAVSLGYFFENNAEYTARSPLAAGTAYAEQIELIKTMAMIAAAMPPEETDDAEATEKESPPVPPSPPQLLQWFQFEGSLRSAAPVIGATTLLSAAEASPRWAAVGQSYGLSVGSDDLYLLSPINFFRKEQDQGGGIFLLHISPPTEGVIFSVFFPLRSSLSDGVWMDMVKEQNIVALRLKAGGATVEMPLYLVSSDLPGLIPIVVEFYIRPYRLEAKISLDGYFQNRVESIPLPGALSGEGRIRLGGVFDKSTFDTSRLESDILANLELEKFKIENSVLEDSITSATTPASPALTASPEETFDMITPDSVEEPEIDIPAEVKIFSSNTIWDELAILFSEVPLVQEELLTAAVTEQNETELQTNKREAERPSERTPIDDQDAIVKPAVVYPPPPPLDSDVGSDSAEADDKETGETPEDENVTLPAGVVTDTDDSIQEHETQEHKTLAVPAENS